MMRLENIKLLLKSDFICGNGSVVFLLNVHYLFQRFIHAGIVLPAPCWDVCQNIDPIKSVNGIVLDHSFVVKMQVRLVLDDVMTEPWNQQIKTFVVFQFMMPYLFHV